jgi:hypothetical protein
MSSLTCNRRRKDMAGKLKERDKLEDLGVDGREILNTDLY